MSLGGKLHKIAQNHTLTFDTHGHSGISRRATPRFEPSSIDESLPIAMASRMRIGLRQDFKQFSVLGARVRVAVCKCALPTMIHSHLSRRQFLSTAVLICHCQQRLSSIIVAFVIVIGPWMDVGKHGSLVRCRDRTYGPAAPALKPINQAPCAALWRIKAQI